jgi:hypothetical protein
MEIPQDFEKLDWHKEVLANDARFKVLVAHRKARKTTLAIGELLSWCATVPGIYWYVAPYREEAKKTVWEDPFMLPRYVPADIWEKRNNSELYVKFPNGSVLYVLGADNPKGHRGPNPMGVVLDEYDYMRPEMWSAVIQPIMTVNPFAWCWFIGTFDGVKDLHAKYQFAKNNKNWYGKILSAKDSGIISSEALEEARKSTTEAFFKQEYLCEAIEGASSFFTNIDYCAYRGTMLPDTRRKYQVGIDLAKMNDYTVITPFDLNSFTAGKQERFNQIDYTLQKARIEAAYLRWNKAQMIIDSTGVGEPVFDDLHKQQIKIEPFHFTEGSRNDLLNNLQILIAQGKIKIPNDDTLLQELRSFQYRLKGRKLRIEAPENGHDDCVMSLALSVWNIPDEPKPIQEVVDKNFVKEFDFYKKKKKGMLTGSPTLYR